MKRSIIILIAIQILLFQFQVDAQNIDISFSTSTVGNETKIYQFGQYKLNINDGFVDVQNSDAYYNGYTAIDLSEEGGLAALLYKSPTSKLEIHSLNGKKIQEITDVSFGNDDPSLQPYLLPGGQVIVRENIANFAFYDATGQLRQTVSNSTSAQEGEAISSLLRDQKGSVILLYNPKIFGGDQPGSRISKLTGNSMKTTLFDSSNRYIKKMKMASNGHYFAIVTARNNTDDQIVVMDIFGNIITEITAREPIADVSFSADNANITLMSSGRMSVYIVMDGERIGSSSIRGSSLLFANYIPEDDLLIGLTGDFNEQTGLITNAEIKAVDFSKRKIATTEIDDALSRTPQIDIDLERKSISNYLLKGLNKHMELTISF